MKLLKHWLLAVGLSSLIGSALAVDLPGAVVSADWLSKNLSEVQVVEVRSDITTFTKSPEFTTDKKTSKKVLVEVGGHIPDSLLLDFKKVRAERLVDGKKVKYLIPEKADFQALMQSVGVVAGKPIVLVPVGQDISDIDEALRAYWQLKVYGEDKVAVLDGGIAGWLADGREFSVAASKKSAGDWIATAYRAELVAGSEDVAKAVKAGVQLIDSRQPQQFFGTSKRDYVGAYGHIAGAKMLAPELLTKSANGALYFLSPKTYEALLSVNGIKAKAPAISYCNSGHLAAGSWFVVSEVVGNKKTRLYDGSLYLWTMEGRGLEGVPLN
jgi:thiosulfate/3-mercaptopyruvate sulfurtransferase